MQFASARLQKPINLRWQDWSFSWPKLAPQPDLGAKTQKSKISMAFWKGILKENEQRQKIEKNPQKTHCRNKHAFPATSLKKWKLKMWKRSFGARPPSKSESWRCENEALVRDLPQNLKVEDVKTKLWCEASLKIWKLKMWKRSSLVQDVPQQLKVEDVKTKLSCESSLKKWKLKLSLQLGTVKMTGCQLQRGADPKMIRAHPRPFRNGRASVYAFSDVGGMAEWLTWFVSKRAKP